MSLSFVSNSFVPSFSVKILQESPGGRRVEVGKGIFELNSMLPVS